MKIKSLNQRLVDHLIQATLIFASVFLAFWLNEYLLEKNEIKYSEEIKNAILIEMKRNLSVLEEMEPYHK